MLRLSLVLGMLFKVSGLYLIHYRPTPTPVLLTAVPLTKMCVLYGCTGS